MHSLCTRYPELVGILAQIGFTDITKPGMLASVGRFMTIPKGAALKKLDMALITSRLRAKSGLYRNKKERTIWRTRF
ncbi:DUF1858 domain-containing protein [Candidatus Formimonas warabiya]|uniref:DUF1858 domain-containing protein n=1 Tax=Formimonas warabiya TaxID=1761012 RepID=UPI0011D178B3|nr:DUF1858 domain-containing protein [Candidatus Formimonas warabiya]